MRNQDWQQIRELFDAARQLPIEARASFLDRECAGNVELRREVESLLGSQTSPELTDGPELAEAPGSRIGAYKLLERIGEGGMGVVFMAEQEEPVRRRVALKIVKLGMDTKQVVARFEQERQALALMEHPNIAKVLDAGTTASGRPYFVMELVRGDPITEYCDRAKLTTRERLGLFMDICRAVQHAHHKGVIHRDLKPSNVLVTVIDGKPVPKVIDFGVAKATHTPLTQRTLFTEFRQMIGTPLYMSPEQAEMSGVDVDTRSDLYSLGVMLYELLTGTTPLTREQLLSGGFAEIHRMIREVEPPKPSTRLATLGKQATTVAAQRGTEVGRLGLLLRGDLDWIVMKCLEKDRTRRYATPTSLAEDVERHMSGEAVLAAPPSALYRIQKFVRRNRGPVAAAAAVVLVTLLGFGAWFQESQRRAAADADRAVAEKGRADEATRNATEQARLAKIAEDRRAAAEKSAREADDQRKLAERLAEEREQEAYFANIAAADAALHSNEVSTARQRLDACPEKLRAWEWSYLRAQSDSSLRAFHTGASSRLLCISRGGRFIATVGDDNLPRVLESTTGKEICALKGHEGSILSIAFGSDGSHVLTTSTDKTVRMWDQLTGKELVVISTQEEHRVLASSWDGKRLATRSDAGFVYLWDIAERRQVAQLRGHDSWVNSAEFSRDGTRVLTASEDKTARIWDFSTARELVVLRGHAGSVKHATFSPDDSRVVTSSDDRTARLWNPISGYEEGALLTHEGPVNSVEFSQDGARVLTTSNDRTLCIWHFSNGEVLRLRGHEDSVYLGRFVEHEAQILSASHDGTMRLWGEVPSNIELRGHESEVVCAAFGPDSSRAVTASRDQTSRIWELDTGRAIAVLRGHYALVRFASLSPDGTRVVTAGGDAKARVWDVSSGSELAVLRGHDATVASAVFSADGAQVLTASWDHTARIWDASSGKPLDVISRESQPVYSAKYIGGGNRIVTTSGDTTVRLWDLKTGKLLASLAGHEGEVFAADVSSDNAYVLTASEDRTARIWDASTGQQILALRGHVGSVCAASFSPDCKRVVTASRDGTARVWDVSRGRELIALREHQKEITYAAFSPNGKRIVTASADGTARVWDSAPFRERYSAAESMRKALLSLKPRLEAAIAAGVPLDAIANSIRSDSSLREAERIASLALIYDRMERVYHESQEKIILADAEQHFAHREAWRLLTNATSTTSDIVRATDLAAKAVQFDNKNAAYRRTLGAAMYRQGKFGESLLLVEESEASHRAKNIDSPADWALLAMIHSKLDQREKAIRALTRARELAASEFYRTVDVVVRLLAEAEAVVKEAFPETSR
ncbi:MAG: protein kinase [Planctomycetes bacterium]|nr:protein kinase [Planctomycetota bacterium]